MRFQTATISRWLRGALMRRLGSLNSPSGLFYPVCLAFVGGLLAAVDATPEAPGFALGSGWLYRAEVGLAFMGAIYLVGMLLRLAWHGRGFFELSAFGVSLKASDTERIRATEEDLIGTREEIVSFRDDAVGSLKQLDARVSAMEDRADL